MRAIILAAGEGKRMRPLTETIPKPLLTIKKVSLLAYHLHRLKQADITEIVINICHLGDKIQACFGNGQQWGVNIIYSVEAKALETGGGIFKALPLLGDAPFLAISGDIWTDYSLSQLPTKISGLAHLVLNDRQSYHPQGDFCLMGDLVTVHGVSKLNFANIGIYHPRLFQHCTEGVFPLAPLLRTAMAKGLVTGEYYTGRWYNVGTPSILQALNKASL